MNYQEPLHICNIDFSKIVYPKIRTNQNKKIILIKYNDKGKLKNFVFQTPTLLNLTKPIFANGYAEIEIGLVGKEKSKVSKFIKFLDSLENKIKSDAQFNGSTWFNINEENKIINFQKIIRESDDYANGTIKIKIIKNNDFETMIQLNNNKRIGVELVPDDSWCKTILECYAVWINANNDFGLFFRPVLCSFTPKEKEVYNYKFLEESDEENVFDIPDTEIKNNIFMSFDSKPKLKNNDSTSQLDLQELVNHLESDDYTQPNTSEINLSIINIPAVDPNKQDNILDINIISKKFSESTSSSTSSINSDSELESDLESSISESNFEHLVDAEIST